jgi:hypothetical protein
MTGRTLLRVVLGVDAAVFLSAAVLNAGIHVPLGFVEVSFPAPVWQAGVGEAVVGVALLAAVWSGRRRRAWIAFGLSVLGIAWGLSSDRVQGPARDIHVLLVPLAIALFVILLWTSWREPDTPNPDRPVAHA